jgi:hypothetical protein
MKQELFKLCEFNGFGEKRKLLYRGSLHGFSSSMFHAKCDNIRKTLIVVKAAESGNIFGGYTAATWNRTTRGGACFKEDASAFLFSLVNRENMPAVKLNISNGEEKNAIFVNHDLGLIFGPLDFCINLEKFDQKESFCLIRRTYNLPSFLQLSTGVVSSFIAGCLKFTIEEIEVFQLL